MNDVLYRTLPDAVLPCRLHEPVLADYVTRAKMDKKSGEKMDQVDRIQLQKSIRFVKKYDFMKKEISDEQGKILAMKLFSNDADILSHMNGAERRRQKMEVLLKKILDNIDQEFDNFLRVLKESQDTRFIAEELERVTVNDVDFKAYQKLIKRDAPENPVKFSTNDHKTLKGELEKINLKPGHLEMIIDRFLSSLIFSPDEHTDILRNSRPLKKLLSTLENSIHTKNVDEFNRILTTAGSLTAINSLDINKTPLKRKRDPDGDSEYWQNKKFHKARKLDKSVERAVVTSWRSSHNLATSAFDETLGFSINAIDHGSIVIQLSPTSLSSWDKLKEYCKTAKIKELVAMIFSNEDVYSKIPEGKFNIPLQIYTVHKESGEKRALIVLENIDKMENLYDKYRDIFKEELEINEDLLTYLVEAKLISVNFSTKIASLVRRSEKMEILFHEIHKHGKVTYDTLVKYAERKKEPLYKLLMTENKLHKAENSMIELDASSNEKTQMSRCTEEHKKELFFECIVELLVTRHERQTRQHGVGVEVTCPRIYHPKCYFEWKAGEHYIQGDTDLTKTWKYVDQPIESEEEVFNKRKLKQDEGEVKGKRAHTDKKPRS